MQRIAKTQKQEIAIYKKLFERGCARLMNAKLFFGAITKFLLGVLIISALLFIPANSFNYPNAWLFMGLLFIPMFIAGIILMAKNQKLLERRLNAREKENDQKQVVLVSGLMFVIGFILAGLNYRYGWSKLPDVVVIVSSVLFIISYAMYGEVLRENAYLSRTIKVEENQKLVSSGLYAVVRHPMYTATVLMFLSIPLILGSFVSFLIFLPYPILIAKRIENEEKVLEKDLKGYIEYKKKVKYKLFPFIW